jgi:hypothetical protein
MYIAYFSFRDTYSVQAIILKNSMAIAGFFW